MYTQDMYRDGIKSTINEWKSWHLKGERWICMLARTDWLTPHIVDYWAAPFAAKNFDRIMTDLLAHERISQQAF